MPQLIFYLRAALGVELTEVRYMAEEVIVTEEGTPKSYTQEEVDSLLQTETDKRVSDALKRADKKKAYEIQEAQKLARMNEAEKFQYELEQREVAISEREKTIALMESRQAAAKILAERGLPITVADFLVTDNAEQTKANIDAFEETFKSSLKTEIEKRLSSSTPKRNIEAGFTKESLSGMKLNEMQQMFKENPELLKQLTN